MAAALLLQGLTVLVLSMAFSIGEVLVILRLESSVQVLIPHWETSVLPEAGATPTSTVS